MSCKYQNCLKNLGYIENCLNKLNNDCGVGYKSEEIEFSKLFV